MKKFIIFFFILSTIACFSQTQNLTVSNEAQTEVYTIVEEMPEFPGGIAEMSNFIRKNLMFPQSAIKDTLFSECKAYIKFIVDEKGDIKNAEIIKSCNGCADCDKEALRVVKSMPQWKPGKMDGRAVKAFYNLPFKFKK
ncbi:MAG: TonB family protein [Bacteroidia bacterium]|nr:TonB family protein [Bacteroidia bacterium]